MTDKFGEITDGEAEGLAKEPGKIFDFVNEKFNVEKEEFANKFEGFNFDEFKDGVTFDEVKDKVSEVFDRLKK